ncbi:phosphatidylglycerophosphatase [Tistlia consotensis]|uniref:Phosphatidylglycerophosphatase A n=1 Tax=Tistlia consotensis USBA 355 TaxID=560819 RepID=A0A1Y6BXV4_9PROT|nr:phosphatidylglycerophosphatase A [Tistlia consotensis]SMF25337.1 phosphatidylglycerophosphatase [Tistlia consotensis USBA 355]SNR59524.1 phosphatidylglycerophosphatase [Tistlia consotensis]
MKGAPAGPTRHLPAWHPAFWIATWFGSGLIPGIPGTWGSLAALPFGAAIMWLWGPWVLLAAAGVLFPIGVWASELYSRAKGKGDPGEVVVDEVVAQWLVMVPVCFNPGLFLVGFFLFRFFDITKVWPASLADRRLGGGFGIMLDDVFAGLYAAALVWGIARLIGAETCFPPS